MTTTQHNAVSCARCGHVFTASTSALRPDATPEVGDVTLCIACAEPHRYTSIDPVQLEPLDLAELDDENRANVTRIRDRLLAMPWMVQRVRGERGA